MPSIFVNYRRQDSGGRALRFVDRAKRAFGRRDVFVDVDSIPPGAVFPDSLGQAVEESKVVVCVIGPRWLETPSGASRPRVFDPADFVRLEIEAALKANKPILILLVAGASLPDRAQLPAELEGLCDSNAIELRDATWVMDCGRAIGAIGQIVGVPKWRRLARRALPAISLIGSSIALAVVARIDQDPRLSWSREVYVLLAASVAAWLWGIRMVVTRGHRGASVLTAAIIAAALFFWFGAATWFYIYVVVCVAVAAAVSRRGDRDD